MKGVVNKRVQQTQSNFSGGYNTRDSALSLAPNESSKMYNCYPGSSQPTPREGTSIFSSVRFDGEVVYTIAFKSNTLDETIIGILTDGRIQAIIKDVPNIIDIADRGVSAPTHDELSHVFADKAVFVFSSKEEYNFIIDEDIMSAGFAIGSVPVSPYFSVRNNFTYNFGSNIHPDKTNSYWWVEPADSSVGDVDPGTMVNPLVEFPNSISSDNLGLNPDSREGMFFGYAIGYVRRIDAEAYEPDGITPKITSVFAPGSLETNYSNRDNVRITGIRKQPLDLLGSKANTGLVISGQYTDVVEEDVGSITLQPINSGGYVWDKVSGLLYRAIKDTHNLREYLADATMYILETFYDEANDGVPNMRVYLPNNTELGPLANDVSASRANIDNIAHACHPYNNGNYDNTVTHIRIYRTLQASSIEAAKGNSYRFLIDLPLKYMQDFNKPYWVDTVSDAELTGSDNVLSFWGTTPPPLGKYSYYHQGRIWVGGEENLPGRAWYSQFPLDATAVRKYLTHFSPDINWIDCNQDTGDFMRGIGETNDQLVFLMTKSVWGVFRGNPEGSGPQRLSNTRGCFSSQSITQVDKTIYYLSQEGPAAIVGREIKLLENFKAGEVWSLQGNVQQDNDLTGKNIFKINEENLKSLRSWYHEETWFISYRYSVDGAYQWICIGFFLSDINDGMGAWNLVFSQPELQEITSITQWSTDKVAFTVGTSPFSYNFLDPKAIDDLGTKFYVGAKSRRFYANPERRERYGNLWDIMIYAQYKDAADLEILVYVDKDNIIGNSAYQQSLIDNQNRIVASRHNIQFGFPEGVFGQFFEIEWRKVFDTDFDMYGFDMRYYLVEGGIPKFTTTDSEILVDVSRDGLGGMNVGGQCQPFIVGPRP